MTQFKKILDILPSALVSRTFGAVSAIEFPAKIQHFINHGFAGIAGLNLDEALNPIDDYKSLNDLFTRELKPEARPIESANVVSPVDGKLSFMGKIQDGTIIEAKGHDYSVSQLIGMESENNWENHAYAFTIYLSPANYHRIHSPISGQITAMSYVPGRLLPVNRLGYLIADDLLPANERLTSIMTDKLGHHVDMVKVGATCVGKISIVYDDMKTNASLFRKPFHKTLEQPWGVNAGDEVGCFELGSTIVLIVDSEGFIPSPELKTGQKIQLGTALGNWS